jgi:hypothetical protein
MPPHAAAGVPFLTATLLSTLMRDDVAVIRIPDRQFVEAVTPCTQPLVVATKRMPSPWNRCTSPGPRIPTLGWPFVLMPVSVPTDVPLQPATGSFCPVMEKPFRFSAMFGAPKAMQGAPVT